MEKQIEKSWNRPQTTTRRARTSKGTNPFFPGVQGTEPTSAELALKKTLAASEEFSFCLPCDVKEEVHRQVASYKYIHVPRYDPKSRPVRLPMSGEKCSCVDACGDDCLNRVLYVECCGDADGKTSNCPVGPTCGNRPIAQRKIAKCQPKREEGKGWGLVTLEDIPKGDLVIEYVGEVIDEDEKTRRLTEWARDHPNDPNFYVMSLRDKWYIDAREQGNMSRFINHSCAPNCRLTQVNVNGFTRNGVYALVDIPAGTFLSYDYHFDTRHGDKFSCRCGAKNCRGTMKGGAASESAVKKSRTELWEEAKAQYDRDKKLVETCLERRERPKSLVDASIPEASVNDELVANGVQERYLRDARRSRLFLWRNAVAGSDLASRFDRLGAKQDQPKT